MTKKNLIGIIIISVSTSILPYVLPSSIVEPTINFLSALLGLFGAGALWGIRRRL